MENTNKKGILVVSLTYFPYFGGAEVSIDEITKRISDFEFFLITLRFDRSLPRYEKKNNVHIYRIGFGMSNPKISERVPFFLAIQKLLFSLVALPTTFRLLRQKKINTYWFMLLNTTTLLWFFLPKRKTIISLQDGRTISEMFSSKFQKLFKFLFIRILQSVHTVQGISNFIVSDALKYRSNNVVLVPNGVDLDHFSKTILESEKLQIRTKYGFSESDVVLVTVSRLVPSRGVEEIIKSIKYLPNNYKLLVVGDGYILENLKNLTHTEKVSDRVVFCGEINHEKLSFVLKSCDVFIRISKYEGMGNSFIEAMASKIPIVGTPVGGIPDFLIDGKTGFFCEFDAPEDTARILVKAKQQKMDVVENAFNLVQSNYSWVNIARRMREILS